MDRVGVLYAMAAYFSWGIFPIYWKLLKHVSSTEIMFHRIVWAFLFYFLMTLWKGRGPQLKKEFVKISNYKFLVPSSLLISLNWYVYIYAVNSNRILQGSLGYYINPIFSVVLGTFLLKEHLSSLKKLAGFLCLLAVILLTIALGELPWISLTLAFSFSLYGLFRKKSKLDVLVHSTLELVFIVPFALALIFYFHLTSDSSMSMLDWILVVLSGVVTGLPLLWFSQAAQRIPLNAMGFFQYISPTLQFLCGFLIYGENVSFWQAMAFALIWCGVGLFLYDTFFRKKRSRLLS